MLHYLEYRKQRERVYFVCLRKDFSSEYTLKYVKPEESYEMIFLNDILEQDVDKNVYINRDDVILDKTPVENQLGLVKLIKAVKVKGFTALSVIHFISFWCWCRC